MTPEGTAPAPRRAASLLMAAMGQNSSHHYPWEKWIRMETSIQIFERALLSSETPTTVWEQEQVGRQPCAVKLASFQPRSCMQILQEIFENAQSLGNQVGFPLIF